MGSTDRVNLGESFAREADAILDRYAALVSEELALLRIEGGMVAQKLRDWSSDPPTDGSSPMDDFLVWSKSMHEAAARARSAR